VAEVLRGPRGRHVPPHGGDESMQFRRWLVQELVTTEVLVHEARAAGLIGARGSASAPAADAPETPAATLPRGVVARLFERVTRGVAVPETEVRAYYERNLDLFRTQEVRRLRHCLSRTFAEASAGVEALEAGEAWDLRRGEFSGPVEEAAFAATPGELIGPLESELGWHVAHLERIDAASILSFEEARPAIEAELLAVARARAFGEWLEERRQALSVIEPEWEHPAHPVHGMVRHRH
jgi:hypothetical protein